MVGPGPSMLEGPCVQGPLASAGPVGRGVRAARTPHPRKVTSVVAVPIAAIMVIAVLAVMPVVMVLVILVVVVSVLALPARTIESRLIFRRPHEIDRPIAGMVFVTVLTPVPGMSGRHVQVNRLRGCNAHRDRLDHHRLRGDER